jgi:hypothetical protein
MVKTVNNARGKGKNVCNRQEEIASFLKLLRCCSFGVDGFTNTFQVFYTFDANCALKHQVA